LRQSTQVPKTSKKRARGVGSRGMVMLVVAFVEVLGVGTGIGEVRSFCTGRRGKGSPVMRGR
jgi:hypothetical protein